MSSALSFKYNLILPSLHSVSDFAIRNGLLYCFRDFAYSLSPNSSYHPLITLSDWSVKYSSRIAAPKTCYDDVSFEHISPLHCRLLTWSSRLWWGRIERNISKTMTEANAPMIVTAYMSAPNLLSWNVGIRHFSFLSKISRLASLFVLWWNGKRIWRKKEDKYSFFSRIVSDWFSFTNLCYLSMKLIAKKPCRVDDVECAVQVETRDGFIEKRGSEHRKGDKEAAEFVSESEWRLWMGEGSSERELERERDVSCQGNRRGTGGGARGEKNWKISGRVIRKDKNRRAFLAIPISAGHSCNEKEEIGIKMETSDSHDDVVWVLKSLD